MVHFYHRAFDGKQRDEIKLEQATVWLEPNKFIADTWLEEFKLFASEFRRMERTLIANNHYAKAKYEDLKPKIDGMKKGGNVFENCSRCHASKRTPRALHLATASCVSTAENSFKSIAPNVAIRISPWSHTTGSHAPSVTTRSRVRASSSIFSIRTELAAQARPGLRYPGQLR